MLTGTTADLVEVPSTALLPHVGRATVSARQPMSRLSALNAVAEGRTLPHPVDPGARG